MTNDDAHDVAALLVDRLLDSRPWPWYVDYDWSAEVLDNNNQVILTTPRVQKAEALVRVARDRVLEREAAREQTDAWLREMGVDP